MNALIIRLVLEGDHPWGLSKRMGLVKITNLMEMGQPYLMLADMGNTRVRVLSPRKLIALYLSF